jgi:S-adenosylmethionine decarboxylase
LDSLIDASNKEAIKSTPIPGLHIVANLAVADIPKLVQSEQFGNFVLDLIAKHNLQLVGKVFHEFDKGGFTAVLCLTESHLSIHTWPEQAYLTFDIFLSNYLKDNRETTRNIYEEVVEFFKGEILFEQIINR